MVAKVRFWVLESSRLIVEASFSVMIQKSLFLYSLFTAGPCFARGAGALRGPIDSNKSFPVI